MAAHAERASLSVGCVCGRCGAPSIVAFSGKRPFVELCNVGRVGRKKITTVATGRQDPKALPEVQFHLLNDVSPAFIQSLMISSMHRFKKYLYFGNACISQVCHASVPQEVSLGRDRSVSASLSKNM